MKKLFKSLLAILLRAALKAASPVLREYVEGKVREIMAKAAETENPYDDIFAEMLADLLEVEY